jgi:hypothetical protein
MKRLRLLGWKYKFRSFEKKIEKMPTHNSLKQSVSDVIVEKGPCRIPNKGC